MKLRLTILIAPFVGIGIAHLVLWAAITPRHELELTKIELQSKTEIIEIYKRKIQMMEQLRAAQETLLEHLHRKDK